MWRDAKKPVEILLHSAVKKHAKIAYRFKTGQAYAVKYKDASGAVVTDEFVFQVRVHLFCSRFAHLICMICSGFARLVPDTYQQTSQHTEGNDCFYRRN